MPSAVATIAVDDPEPEYESVDAFAEYLADDDRTSFRPVDVVKLMQRTGSSREAVTAGLVAYGFAPARRSA